MIIYIVTLEENKWVWIPHHRIVDFQKQNKDEPAECLIHWHPTARFKLLLSDQYQ